MLNFMLDYWWFIAPLFGLTLLGLIGAYWPSGRFGRHDHKN